MSSCTVPVAPAPPALKDLPKVAGDLKSELEGFSSSKLKNAETQEKIVLPSAEGRKIILFFFYHYHFLFNCNHECCLRILKNRHFSSILKILLPLPGLFLQ